MASKKNCCESMLRYVALTSMIVLAFVLTGCAGDIIDNKVESKIEESLPSLVGPAKSYDVEVHGSHRKMIKGQIEKLIIHGEDVWLMPDLCIDHLTVNMTDVAADRKKSVLKSVGKTDFEATISEKSLNKYIDKIRTDDPEIKLVQGKMKVHGRPKAWIVSANVDLTGSLEPKGDKLYLKIDRFEVAGIKAPAIGAKMLEDWINPVVDLGITGLSPELKSVDISPGAMRIVGVAHLTGQGLDRGATQSNRK
ncbi:MAG: DUF2993 domain-containing protein [Armatimonadota bacterium]